MGGVSVEELQALFETASNHFEAGDPAAARDALIRLLEYLPDNPQILTYLGTTTHQTGDWEGARAYFERAVAVQPDFDEAWRNLAQLSFDMGDTDGAIAAFTRLCQLTPMDSQAHAWLGDVLQAQDRYTEALAAYEQALTLNPLSASLWTKKSRVLLQEGSWEAALDATERATAIQPGRTGALALRSVALAELGREGGLRELVDFEGLIQAFAVDTPNGFDDMGAFNRALSAFCIEHPTLTFNPADKTTTEGSQTANLSGDAVVGPLAALRAAIAECADAYAAAHPLVPGHPFLGQRPAAWTIVIWGTVLARHGHQGSHIHRDAWLSGVYYAQVPDVLRHAEGDQAGWIEFGRPQSYPKAKTNPAVRRYPPVEGTLYMFPSYFYHRTIPFEADVRRVSIAFDLIPAQAT